MTGSLQVRKTSAGKKYYYISLSYKEANTGKWKVKNVPTHLTIKGNKRKAEAMIPKVIEDYSYLERCREDDADVPMDISVCQYLDLWLAEKEGSIMGNTHDTYAYRIVTLKRYFEEHEDYPVRSLTAKKAKNCFDYMLKYGKKTSTGEKKPLSVRSVRSCKSILYAVCDDAIMRGILTSNPIRDVKVTNKKNSDFSEEMLFLNEDEIREMLVFFWMSTMHF